MGQYNLWGQAGPDQAIACDQATMAATVGPGYWTDPLAAGVTYDKANESYIGRASWLGLSYPLLAGVRRNERGAKLWYIMQEEHKK